MKMEKINYLELYSVIDDLKNAFKDDDVKLQVLDDIWLEKSKETKIDETGFCFYASEVIYRLFGGKDFWTLKRISKEDFDDGPHYFLFNKENNTILDITSKQYSEFGIEIPYEKGKGRGLQNISKKSKILANSIGKKL
jgi:hypothetical protein